MSALLWGITSNQVGDFYCLNCLHSFRTENKLVCKNKKIKKKIKKIKENNKILKCNHGEKSMRVPFIICADTECLL